MRPRRRYLLAAAAAIAVLPLTGDRSDGFSYYQLDGVNVVWSTGQSIRYLSPTTFPEGSETDQLILASMGLWNMVTACDFEYFYWRLDQDYPIDNYDGYCDTAAVPSDQLDPGVLGVTYLVNMGAEWFDADVLFSDNPSGVGYSFDPYPPCDVVANPTPVNGYSFYLIALHELGHALGLGHDPVGDEPAGTPWFAATMNPRYPGGGPFGQFNIVELHSDDRAGAKFLYPHSGPSEPPLIDLALSGYTTSPIIGKVEPVWLDPPVLYPGEEVVSRSVIENLGDTNELYVTQGFYLSDDELIDTSDLLLGFLEWEIVAGDALEFDVATALPDDLAAGTYTFGSIIDDTNLVPENYEDNNEIAYCQPLTVLQYAPSVLPLDQQVIPCGSTYVSPAPQVTHPINMGPITWSLDNPEPGMTINGTTGVVRWIDPVPSTFLYAIRVRATNAVGTDSLTLFLGVEPAPPQIVPIADQAVSPCLGTYTGPTPVLTSPDCMSPIINWSLDVAPPGMTIDHGTGVVQWQDPIASSAPHTITVRATNAVGNGTVTWHLTAAPMDFTGDGILGWEDVAHFWMCLAGPALPSGAYCTCADANTDGHVDLRDFAVFQTAFAP